MANPQPTRHTRRWLPEGWELTRPHLPAAPATVLEVGCGTLGGFVPALEASGYRAIGVDPNAPAGEPYRAVPLDEAELPAHVDAAVASMSLHHIVGLDAAVDLVADRLGTGGVFVVLEMDWPAFDDASAQWCFERLAPPSDSEPPGWLAGQREQWRESGLTWSEFRMGWATDHGLHTGARVLDALDRRFERVSVAPMAYYFTQLDDSVTPDVERAAVAAGELADAAFRYVGVVPAR